MEEIDSVGKKSHRVSRNLAKLLSNQHFGVGRSQELKVEENNILIYAQFLKLLLNLCNISAAVCFMGGCSLITVCF